MLIALHLLSVHQGLRRCILSVDLPPKLMWNVDVKKPWTSLTAYLLKYFQDGRFCGESQPSFLRSRL